jgi:imidazolonepropionase-like amidohydrolase
LYKELEIMIEEGMTSMEAVKSATIFAAECLNIQHKTGSIKQGKSADLLLVDGNPLDDITALKQVKQVYRSGELCLDHLISNQIASNQNI